MDNGTIKLLSLFDERDIFLLKQVCALEDEKFLLLKIDQGRVVLKANGAMLDEKDRKSLTAKLREFTELLTDRTVQYYRNGSVKRDAERKSGLTGTIKFYLSQDGGIERTRYIVGDTLIENGFIVPGKA